MAVNVTGFGVMPTGAAVAVKEFAPATVPRVHDVAVAMPDAFVVTAVAGTTLPPPLATAKVTETPETGLLLASRITTAGAVVTALPAAASCALPVLMAIWVGAPAVMVIAVEVSGVSAPLLNWRVRVPTVPEIESPAKVASPPALVFTVAVPPSGAPAAGDGGGHGDDRRDRIARGVPDLDRRLQGERRPFAAEADGCCTMVSWAAAPAVTLIALMAGASTPR
ncbi:MAG: hypothetical protein R2910_10450 [Gemmatimonadales bacterium]